MAKAKAMKKAMKKPSKTSKGGGIVSKVASKAMGAIGGGFSLGGKRGARTRGRRKKSAYWYAKEIQRIKLKRKYEKVKLGVTR